jgi:hypothetical protein
MSAQADDYRAHAEYCRSEAQKSTNAYEISFWSLNADAWMSLARDSERPARHAEQLRRQVRFAPSDQRSQASHTTTEPTFSTDNR